MSLESITERIRQEAEAYGADQKARAEAAKQGTLEDARRKAEAIKAKRAAEAEKDSQVLRDRRASVADLESRKMKLAAKQEVIEASYSRAAEKLRELDDDKYQEFMTGLLEEFKAEGGEVLVNAEDRARMSGLLEKKFSGTDLKLSQDTADIKGGFILRRGNISYNASVEQLLENVKGQATSEIASLLFPDE